MVKLIVGFILPQLIVFGTTDRIQKAMEKKEYDKAYELIVKGYEKEPVNPGLGYLKSLLFFNRDYANYNIDTARFAILKSREDLVNANSETIEDLKEDGITKEKINILFEQIRDRSFQKTLQQLTVESAIDFQIKYPSSVYDDILTYKIDSIEYDQAVKSKTQLALTDFIADHPTSIFKPKADSILDDMRFSDLEKKGNLNAYYGFLEKYPFTRHRRQLEQYILKVSTASGEIEKFESFISLSKIPELKKRAADVRYYLSDKTDYIFHPTRDSLKNIIANSALQLFPVVENGLIGFYNRRGGRIISPQFYRIPDTYKCEVISDDWLLVHGENSGAIITKTGRELLVDVDDFKSLSEAVGLVKQNEKWWLYHKSGFQILKDAVDDAEVLSNSWIKIKQRGKWGLTTIMGLRIAESIYESIEREGAFWVFEKDERLAVYTSDLILKEVEERGLSLEFKFDDIEAINRNAIIGFRGSRECLLDSTLNFRIPWGDYEIHPEASGWYLRSDQGYRLYNESEEEVMDKNYPYIESNSGWLAIQTQSDWMLLPRKKGLLPSRNYDSIKLVNSNVALLVTEEGQELLFSSGDKIKLDNHRVINFPNRPDYLMLSKDGSSGVYDKVGKEVISGEFEKISFLNDSLIRVEIRGRQGLIHTSGEWVLNPVFDSIDEKNGLVLTLIDGKIGCYDPLIHELIATAYEARVERFGKNYLAKKDGKKGVIDFSKNEIISFSYDEIKQWNDTSYLVQNNNSFFIINTNEKVLTPPMENLKTLFEDEEQTIFRFVQEGKYGLISTKNGLLLKPEFTDVFNIGESTEPLFFADQHLDKAGFHVVSYINSLGDLVLSKAYTREEFDQVLCDD